MSSWPAIPFHGNPNKELKPHLIYSTMEVCCLPETWESGHLVVQFSLFATQLNGPVPCSFILSIRVPSILAYVDYFSTLWYLVYYRPLQQKKWCSTVLSLWERGNELPYQKAIWLLVPMHRMSLYFLPHSIMHCYSEPPFECWALLINAFAIALLVVLQLSWVF